jgi:ATP phosphoribosyltransferase regulatory subunit
MPSDEHLLDSAASSPPRSLEHPLPAGMRDLLPAEAASRRAIARTCLDRFALHGYALVTLPAFEFADVLERGLGALDPSDIIRFVEPESGEVAALRPDMTPQIARMIATRLRAMPPPLRLSYEGTVLRRRSGRAHKHRQIPQVGVELGGVSGPEGDLELLAVAADALRATGLERFAIDLGDAGIVRALLPDATSDVAERVTAAVAKKDDVALADAARDHSLLYVPELRELTRLQGDRAAIVEGLKLLRETPARAAIERLAALFDAAAAAGLASSLTADLGEVRGFSYYTGPIFHILASGPGEAIGSGGRYDDLLGRFGAPMPAAGFALDLDRLTLALRVAGVSAGRTRSVVVVGAPDDPRVAEWRGRGVTAVVCATRVLAFEYARAWGFTHVLDSDLVEVKGA